MPIEAASLLIRVSADTKNAEKELSSLSSRLGGLFSGVGSGASGAASSLTRMFETAGGFLLAQGVQQATSAVISLGSTALETYAYTERLRFSLQAMAGRELVRAGVADSMAQGFAMASDRAAELQGWVEQLAIFSPFTVKDVADSFRLAQAYGFTGDAAKHLTTVMADFTAGTGQSGFTMHRATLALGQMQQRGKVASQELNQLSEAGINAREILAQAFGKTTAEITKMVEKGLIPADVAVESILRSLEKDFQGMAKAQAGTFSGLISSLQDFKDLGLRDLFAGTLRAIQPYLERFVNLVTSEKFRQGIRDFGDAIGGRVTTGLQAAERAINRFNNTFQKLGGGLKGLSGGLADALGIPEFVIQLGLAAVAVAGAATAIGLLGAILSGVAAVVGFLVTPLGLAAVAVTALGFAWAYNFMGIQDATLQMWAQVQPILAAFVQWLGHAIPFTLGFLWGVVQSVWAGIAPVILDAWARIQPVLLQLGQWLMVNIPVALGVMWIAAVVAWGTMAGAISGAWARIDPILGWMQERMQTDLPAAIESFQAAWEGARAAAEPLVQWAVGVLAPAIARLQTAVGSLGKSFDELKPKFEGLGQAIQNMLARLAPVLAMLAAALFATFVVVGSLAVNTFSALMTNLPGIVGPMIDQLTDTINTISETVSGMVATVKSIIDGDWTGAWTNFKGVVDTQIGFVERTVERVKTQWGALFGAIGQAIRDTLTDIGIDPDEVIGSITGMWDGLVAEATNAWNGVVGAVTGAWANIQAVFGQIGATIQQWLAPVGLALLAIGAFFAPAVERIQIAVGGLGEKFEMLKGKLQPLSDAFMGLMAAVGGLWMAILAVAGTVATALKPAFDAIGGAVTTAMEAVSGAVNTAKEALAGFGQAAVDNFMGGISAFVSTLGMMGATIVGTVMVLVSGVMNLFASILTYFPNVIGVAFDQVKLTFESITQVVQSVANAIIAVAQGDWQRALDEIKKITLIGMNYVGGTFTNLKLVAVNMFNLIKDTIVNTLTDMGVDVPALLETLQAGWDPVWENLKTPIDAIVTAIQGVMGKVAEFQGWIAGITFRNPFGDLLDGLGAAGATVQGYAEQAGRALGFTPDPGRRGGKIDSLYGFAKGGKAKGLAVVGENGPELAFFGGAGADILSNPDSIKWLQEMFGLPGFAGGTTPKPPIGPNVAPTGNTATTSSGFGTWVIPGTQWASATGNSGRMDDAAYEQKVAAVAGKAFEGAAEETTNAFAKAADMTLQEFTSALRGVPGLFDASKVTEDQMKLAEMGVPQNFADDYLRRLTDEVLNGVEWADVDIKDAAARAGIDPNLPAEAILEMFTQAWNDSSLFANPENLDLINMDAVQAAIAKQAAQKAGEANILSLFGITPEDTAAGSKALTDGLMSGITSNIAGSEAGAAAGEALIDKIATGVSGASPDATQAIGDSLIGGLGNSFVNSFQDGEATGKMVAGMASSLGSQDSITQLENVGANILNHIFNGYRTAAGQANWAGAIPPGGNAAAPPPATGGAGKPAGAVPNAAGTSSFRGGWSLVGEEGPELMRLPRGTRIWDAQVTAGAMGGGGVTIEKVVINNGMDVADLGYRIEQAQRRRRGR